MKQRKVIEETFFKYLLGFFTYSLIAILFFIVFEIVKKGFPALSWSMITEIPKGGFYFGKEGGIFNAIIGSLYLALGASIIAVAVSLPVALFINISLVKFESFNTA